MAELRENLARLKMACDNPRSQLDNYLLGTFQDDNTVFIFCVL